MCVVCQNSTCFGALIIYRQRIDRCIYIYTYINVYIYICISTFDIDVCVCIDIEFRCFVRLVCTCSMNTYFHFLPRCKFVPSPLCLFARNKILPPHCSAIDSWVLPQVCPAQVTPEPCQPPFYGWGLVAGGWGLGGGSVHRCSPVGTRDVGWHSSSSGYWIRA